VRSSAGEVIETDSNVGLASSNSSVAAIALGPNLEDVEMEDETDVTQGVVDDTTFEERVEMVGDILGTTLPTTSTKSGNFALSVYRKAGTDFKRLPPSLMFKDKFSDFVAEAAAKEGSFRARNAKNKQPCGVGKLPNRPKPKMQFYEIGECPWQTEGPQFQKKLFDKSLYCGSSHPTITISAERLREWETMGHENVSILSHVDHFVAV
jgi:hypothetical protein